MIAKSYILANLNQMEAAYKKATPKYALYFSKLAILELCGWIEVSIDSLITSCAQKKLVDNTSSKYIASALGTNYGFHYNKHLRDLIVKLVGIRGFENIESKSDTLKIAQLESELNALYLMRNSLAHTYVKGKPGTISIDAPSVTLRRFQRIYAGLLEVEAALKAE